MRSIDIKLIVEWLVALFLRLVVLSGFALFLFYQNRKRENRRNEMRAFAAQNGWQFSETFVFPFLMELAHYSGKAQTGLFGKPIQNPLTVGSKNVVSWKINERNVAVFDQIYLVTGAKGRKYDRSQTLVAIEAEDLFLPIFCLEPESFANTFTSAMKRFDIDFPTHPNFSRNYFLYGQDANQIQNAFTTTVLNFYEQYPIFTTVAGGKYLVIFQEGRTLKPTEIISQVNFLSHLVEVFKHRR